MDGSFVGVVGAAVGDGVCAGSCICVGVVVAMGVGSSGACVGPEQPIRAARMNRVAARVSFCTVGLLIGVFQTSGIISSSGTG